MKIGYPNTLNKQSSSPLYSTDPDPKKKQEAARKKLLTDVAQQEAANMARAKKASKTPKEKGHSLVAMASSIKNELKKKPRNS